MTINVDLTNNFPERQFTAKINTYNEKPNVLSESNNTEENTIDDVDELLASQTFIPPYEYYASLKDTTYVLDNNQQGFYYVNPNNVSTPDDDSYFWLDDIKNWCRFIYSCDNESSSSITLSIWNGKDNWIMIPNFVVGDPNAISNVNFVDKYGIKKIQQPIIDKALANNLVILDRGWCQAINTDDDGNWVGGAGLRDYFYQQGYLQVVKLIRLQKTVKYTINKSDTFITNRWSSSPYYYSRTYKNVASKGADEALGRYTQVNSRVPITTGIPSVWRLPTGEIGLCGSLSIRSDNGAPYHYEVHSSDGQELWKFRKQYDKATDGYSYMGGTYLLGDNAKTANAWLNETCANFFGDGRDKTIEKDWLREYNITESNNSVVTNYNNMLDSTLSFEQHNINKENSLKCSFTINRPVVTTETIERVDYAKKW